jgi:hypothetical protein
MLDNLSNCHWGLIAAMIAIYAMERRLDRIAQLLDKMAGTNSE